MSSACAKFGAKHAERILMGGINLAIVAGVTREPERIMVSIQSTLIVAATDGDAQEKLE